MDRCGTRAPRSTHRNGGPTISTLSQPAYRRRAPGIAALLTALALTACGTGAAAPASVSTTVAASPVSATIRPAPTPETTAAPIATPTATPPPTGTPASTATPAPTVTPIPIVAAPSGPPEAPDARAVNVVRVIDGDTIVVLIDGVEQTVGYIGVNAPERGFATAAEPLAEEAAAMNGQLLGAGTVYLQRAGGAIDATGRALSYVWVSTGSTWMLVNEQLVLRGLAAYASDPAGSAFDQRLFEAQSQATTARVGIWALPDATPAPTPTPDPRSDCDPSYPTLCIPIDSPELDCADIGVQSFPVQAPDPMSFDGDGDGLGCEPPPAPRPTPRPHPKPTPKPHPKPIRNCDPSYPTLCIPRGAPDLDCGDIPWRHFPVRPPDPMRFDGDHDGIGCES
jgi:micrococcal nuclease